MFSVFFDGFILLVMSYTGKKALQMKLAYIVAFNAMKEKLDKLAEEERARIRHQALAATEAQAQVFEFLKGEAGIAGIKPGRNSFLLLLEPGADLEQICAHLETAFPALGAPQAQARATKRGSRHCRLLAMLTCGLTTVGLALTGLKHAHAVAGGIFALLATDHVWKRRKAL